MLIDHGVSGSLLGAEIRLWYLKDKIKWESTKYLEKVYKIRLKFR